MSTVTQPGGAIFAGNVFLVNIFQYVGNQLGMFGIHYQCISNVGTPVTLGLVAKTIADRFIADWSPDMDPASVFLGAKASMVNVVPKPLSGIALDGTAGAAVSTVISTQTSGICTLKTALAGRKYRGRFYMPFPVADNVDTDGSPNAGYVADLDTLAGDIVTDITITPAGGSSEISPVIWHKATSTFTPVTGHTARKEWATQRRRGQFGRPNSKIIS